MDIDHHNYKLVHPTHRQLSKDTKNTTWSVVVWEFQNDKTKKNETNYHVIKNIPKVNNKKNQYTNHVFIVMYISSINYICMLSA
jgi:hypothetical protein